VQCTGLMGFRVASRSSDLEAIGKFNTRSGMMPKGKVELVWLVTQSSLGNVGLISNILKILV